MTGYVPPLDEMRFMLRHLADLEGLGALPGLAAASPDVVDQVLEEAGRLAASELAPLNEVGDRERARLENGVVRTPPGFKAAYRHFVQGGWPGLPFPEQFGGQALPWTVSTAVGEMWHSANMAFGLCPLLTEAAADALLRLGSQEQKERYLEKLVSGAWTGTMCLTEPQAGTDVGALRTRAEPDGDRYRIRGTKIFITYGEHDWTDNIIHMVLARTPGAAAGTRGISLFLVPKVLVNDDGSLGPRNDLRCVSLEHKLGIHASPTCVMAFGENEGAVGYLVGEEQGGMQAMFTMMNHARLQVGLEGLAIAERAFQRALAFARERVQGRRAGDAGGPPARIIEHPDVRRMLMTMKVRIEAMRALVYTAAAATDRAEREPEPEARHEAKGRLDLLIPLVKAWCSDSGFELASTGLQVHGGMGFIEETGAAQHLRDARINMIYEGTNGIQALDLVGRKLVMDEGRLPFRLFEELRGDLAALEAAGEDELAQGLRAALDGAVRSTRWLQARLGLGSTGAEGDGEAHDRSSSAKRGSGSGPGLSSAQRDSRDYDRSSSAKRDSRDYDRSSSAERGSQTGTGSSSAQRGSQTGTGSSSAQRGSQTEEIDAALAGATPYLRQLAVTLGGFLLARALLAARRSDHPSVGERRISALFYLHHVLPPAVALEDAVVAGAEVLDSGTVA